MKRATKLDNFANKVRSAISKTEARISSLKVKRDKITDTIIEEEDTLYQLYRLLSKIEAVR